MLLPALPALVPVVVAHRPTLKRLVKSCFKDHSVVAMSNHFVHNLFTERNTTKHRLNGIFKSIRREVSKSTKKKM